MISLIWTIVVVLVVLWLLGFAIHLYLGMWFLMEPPQGTPHSATRNVGDRLRAMGQEIREDFRTGFFRSQAGGPTPPPPPGSPPPASPPEHSWWGSGNRGRPRG